MNETPNSPQDTLSLRAWFDNFWYHNKWKTIFVLFIAAVLLICLMQMGNKTEFDAQILYTGPTILEPSQKAEIESAFAQLLAKDYNGDGLKNAQLADLTILTEAQYAALREKEHDVAELVKYNSYTEAARGESFTQEVTAGENVICLLDPHWYGIIKERGGLVKLDTLLGQTPENALDDYGIYLKDTDFSKFFAAFDVLPDDTVLCMRILSSAMLLTGSDGAKQKHENHQEIFTTVMNFTLPEGFVTRPPVQETPNAEKKED